jgi:hypothetical protein
MGAGSRVADGLALIDARISADSDAVAG